MNTTSQVAQKQKSFFSLYATLAFTLLYHRKNEHHLNAKSLVLVQFFGIVYLLCSKHAHLYCKSFVYMVVQHNKYPATKAQAVTHCLWTTGLHNEVKNLAACLPACLPVCERVCAWNIAWMSLHMHPYENYLYSMQTSGHSTGMCRNAAQCCKLP